MLNPFRKIARITSVVTQADKRIKAEMTLLLILCIFVLMTLSWQDLAHNQLTGGIETESAAYLDDTLHKAGAAFLIARALNATISVMQSFTITPFLGELSLGEVLDPVNDLVERFSLVMLAVTVSIGIQQLLMEIGIAVDMTYIILPALILILVSLFSSTQMSKHRLRMLAYKLLLFVLLVRFAIPMTGLIGSQISASFLADKRDTAMESIEKSKEKISAITITEAAASPKDSLKQLKKDSQEIVGQIIKLITLFVFETILFPLLVLWGLIKLFGIILYSPLSIKTE
ncbi:MAG: hypothetical protein DRR16_01930 [Candidatus Parabeggiatoa sp. nov. 3]|nr:MAG: hypothetical protein DRR00_11840 [Gammaproteobacteria bacterium]RKZ67165.1 MAG: hypothetical protein DRQ99_07450 [Gammaproteobacteria bacterium]RKZ89731.1 MAG: hypothetical protein DRR16_01930 [Gammaproteobacteria bacterium]